MTAHPEYDPDRLRAWGKFAHHSPLYSRLVEVVASDTELMRIMNRMENQLPPNLLFAGVQFLLADDPDDPLAAFYPSIVEDPRPADEVDPYFRDFVFAHEEGLVEIGRTRLTQTNECRRCSALLPMIWRSDFDRFHLIDLGTSAGLNLAMDRYSYRWGDLRWGEGDVLIEAESRGSPPMPRSVDVLSRTGLDLNPLDPTSEDDRRWLDALIWPEHHERRARLNAALELMAGLDFEIVAGSALETLGPALDRLPAGEPAVVVNSFVLIQMTPEQRAEIDRIVGDARSRRPVYRVSMEAILKSDGWALLSVDDGSGPVDVGRAHPHGEWVNLTG